MSTDNKKNQQIPRQKSTDPVWYLIAGIVLGLLIRYWVD